MKKEFALSALVFLVAFMMVSATAFGLYETTQPWLMYRHDLSRSGTTDSTAPNINQTLWTHTSTTTTSTPIVADGKVIFYASSKVYAIDETTGVKLWESISLPSSLRGVPAFEDGKIFVGSYGGYMYCLNATTGIKIWEYDASPGRIEGSPAVHNGRVYFGTAGTDKYLYAINASNGLSLSPAWRYSVPGDIYSTPAIDGDLLYFGCDDARLYALNISGNLPALKWFANTKGRVRTTPTAYGGMVIFGTYSQDHSVLALNKTTGNLIWAYELTNSWYIENPVVAVDNVVYFAPEGGNKVYALYANAVPGNYTETNPSIRKWSQTLDNYYPSETVVADDKIFFSASYSTYKLYALDIADGHTLWTYDFAGGTPGSPIIADGRIFISRYNTITCFGSPYPPVTYYYTLTPVPAHTFVIKLDINATPSSQLDVSGLTTLYKISFTLEGITGTTGMSNITIPHEMLGGPYTVTVDGGLPISQSESTNGTHTSLYFTYLHSTHTIEVLGTTAIPEFAPTAILPLLIIVSLIALALARKRMS